MIGFDDLVGISYDQESSIRIIIMFIVQNKLWCHKCHQHCVYNTGHKCLKHFLHNLQVGPICKPFYSCVMLHSILIGPFVSYEENEVLCIRPQQSF
jgi:hypothetical protein